MNKLFIIGNGFDLAHGYPTKYDDFLKWIWNNIQKNPQSDKFKKLLEINTEVLFLGNYSDDPEYTNSNINCYKDFINCVSILNTRYGNIQYGGIRCSKNFEHIYTFNNRFFYQLSIEYSDAKWSDIESLFYTVLIEVLEGTNKNGIDIDSLNSDMESIKKLFSEYLSENINYKDLDHTMPFPELLRYKSKNLDKMFLSVEGSNFLNEFPSALKKELIKFDSILKTAEDFNKWSVGGIVPQTLILDFNYTETIHLYINYAINRNSYEYGTIEHIKIHGQLNNNSNPINLGFGDEMDDYYKILEKKNDNRYLMYIKSFMYSNNTNYRKLLNWIDSNNFQVYILGHSCGLSDRIMLNTIFEHQNCHSIKVFYFQWEQDGVYKNDFTEKIQNISRHFNKKKQMRDKIVDKSLSQPLKVFN